MLFVGALSASSARAFAQELPAAPPAAPLDDSAIEAALREQAARAHTHRYAWTGINGALAVGAFALLPALDRASRPDFIVAGVGSLLGTIATFAFPLRVESDAAELDAIAREPEPERHRRLRAALQTDADDERDRLSLPWHVVNFGVSAVAGGIIAFGFHHAWSGIAQGVSSFALGEAQLFTQPTGLNDFSRSPSVALGLRPQISIQSRGLYLGLIANW
jgi:hypothetical protein